jgi:hypothetical protein
MATVRFLETSSGAWIAQPFTVGVCTDSRTRLELGQCLARTEWVVGPVL